MIEAEVCDLEWYTEDTSQIEGGCEKADVEAVDLVCDGTEENADRIDSVALIGFDRPPAMNEEVSSFPKTSWLILVDPYPILRG